MGGVNTATKISAAGFSSKLPESVPIVCLAVGEFLDGYVTKLESMLRRHMPVPFELTCVVDRPRDFPDSIRTIDVRGWPAPRLGMRPTTYKLCLFDPERLPLGEFLYLDTSLVIRNDMTPLLEYAFGQPRDLVAVKDWNYDTFNSSVMRIRQTEVLAAVPNAYESGECFPQRVPGDQDFMTGVIRSRGWQDHVTTFPEGMIQSYGVARRASKQNKVLARKMLDEAVIVKFNGPTKMHNLLDPRFRLARMIENKNPLHRTAWFWVSEIKKHWR